MGVALWNTLTIIGAPHRNLTENTETLIGRIIILHRFHRIHNLTTKHTTGMNNMEDKETSILFDIPIDVTTNYKTIRTPSRHTSSSTRLDHISNSSRVIKVRMTMVAINNRDLQTISQIFMTSSDCLGAFLPNISIAVATLEVISTDHHITCISTNRINDNHHEELSRRTIQTTLGLPLRSMVVTTGGNRDRLPITIQRLAKEAGLLILSL